jgi:hypothetical protein
MLKSMNASRKLALDVRNHEMVVLTKTTELLIFGRLKLWDIFKTPAQHCASWSCPPGCFLCFSASNSSFCRDSYDLRIWA